MIAYASCAACGARITFAPHSDLNANQVKAYTAVAAMAAGWVLYRSTADWHCPRCDAASHDSVSRREAIRARAKALAGWAP